MGYLNGEMNYFDGEIDVSSDNMDSLAARMDEMLGLVGISNGLFKNLFNRIAFYTALSVVIN